MLRRINLLLLVVLSLLAVVPAFAQDATPLPPSGAAWTVSLYSQPSGMITRVAPTGDVIGEFMLPRPEGFDSHEYVAVTSPLGNYIAYIVSQVGDGTSATQPGQVLIYDTATSSLVATYDLNAGVVREGINAASNSLRFSADGTRLLFAYYIPTGNEGQHNMELVVLDATTGQVINTLSSEGLAGVMQNPNTAYSIQVTSFQDDVATFVLRPIFVGMEGTSAAVINWNVTTNEVTVGATQLLDATDTLAATSESLLVIYDPAADELAEGETRAEGTLRSPNTVQLYDPATGTAQTIFAQDVEIAAAKFVQNGERILVFTDFGSRGILIERDGTVLQEFDMLPGITYTFGTPDGFVYTDPQQVGTLLQVTTRDNDFTSETFYMTDAPFSMLSVQDYQVIPPAAVG